MRCAVYRNSASRRLKSPKLTRYYNSNNTDIKDPDLTDTDTKDIPLKTTHNSQATLAVR